MVTNPDSTTSREPVATQGLLEFLEAVPDAMLLMDEAGTIRAVNRHLELLFGYGVGELCGQPVEALVPLHARAAHAQNRASFVADPRRRSMADGIELCGLRKDGSEFPAEVSLASMRTAGGVMLTAAVRDLTERRRALEQRQTLERRLLHAHRIESLTAFAGGVAHDFNNLLVGIVGNVGLVLRALPPDSPIRDLLHDMENAAQRATALSQQMLAFSGKGKFLVERIDLRGLVSRVVADAFDDVAGAPRLTLSPDTPSVDADAGQLAQAIRALLVNAIEASGALTQRISVSTGAIELTDEATLAASFEQTLTPGSYAFVEVSDEGIGMDAATRARMFDPFFTTKFAGRGLGLAAALGIVRGHHGAIRVRSAPGRGTTMQMLLPLPRMGPGSSLKPSLPVESSMQRETILIVDDESHVRRVLRTMLLRLGFSSVLSAADGCEALQIYGENQASIGAVILDVTMPRMGGVEALAALRALDRHVKVLMMSGYSEEGALGNTQRTSLLGFLQKPFSVDDLARALSPVRFVANASTRSAGRDGSA